MMTLVEILDKSPEFDEIYQSRYEAWGERLTFSDFIEREITLKNTSWAKSGLKTWALISGTGMTLASCETFPMQICVKSEILPGVVIASVVVNQTLRKKGYATVLLKQLTEVLMKAGDFICLFSEVGPQIYARCGFKNYPIYRATLKITQPSFEGNNIFVQSLSKENAIDQWKYSIEKMSNSILLPLKDQILWSWDRSEFYARKFGKEVPTVFALKCNDSLLIFCHDFKYEKLKVLHSNRGPITNDIEWSELWRRLSLIAKENNFDQIVAWCPARLTEELQKLKSTFSISIDAEIEDLPMFIFKRHDNLELEVEYQCWV